MGNLRPAGRGARSSSPWRDGTAERRAESQARTRAGGGGEGPNVDAWPIALGGKSFWPPEGLPVPAASGTGSFLSGKETFLHKGESQLVVLLGAHQFGHGHSPQVWADQSVLPRMIQARAAKNTDVLKATFYNCTLTTDVGATSHVDAWEAMEDGWTPDPTWKPAPEQGAVLEDGHFTVGVEAEGDGWVAVPPPALLYLQESMCGPWETQEEAQWAAEGFRAQARSCGFCAQKAMEIYERVPKGDSLVWPARGVVFIPSFSLAWLFGQESTKEGKSGYFRYDEGGVEPEGTDRAVREGFVWLRGYPQKTNKGSAYRTFEEYGRYVAQLACTCTNCLDENGARKGRREHDLVVRQVLCSECGEEFIPTRLVDAAPVFQEPDLLDDGSVDWSTAGWWQMTQTAQGECPHCQQMAWGDPVLECSSCDNPRPMMPYQTVTRMTRDMDGGYYRFAQVAGDEDGRIFWEEWDIPLVHGGPALDRDKKQVLPDTVEGVLRPAIQAVEGGTFGDFLTVEKSPDYAQLTPRQQVQLIGGSVFGRSAKSERR